MTRNKVAAMECEVRAEEDVNVCVVRMSGSAGVPVNEEEGSVPACARKAT